MLVDGREQVIERMVEEARQGRRGDRRDALRHLGAWAQLDGDLRVRHGREGSQGVKSRAVVFDLWNTIAVWPGDLLGGERGRGWPSSSG